MESELKVISLDDINETFLSETLQQIQVLNNKKFRYFYRGRVNVTSERGPKTRALTIKSDRQRAPFWRRLAINVLLEAPEGMGFRGCKQLMYRHIVEECYSNDGQCILPQVIQECSWSREQDEVQALTGTISDIDVCLEGQPHITLEMNLIGSDSLSVFKGRVHRNLKGITQVAYDQLEEALTSRGYNISRQELQLDTVELTPGRTLLYTLNWKRV